MAETKTSIERPQRWSDPFCREMSAAKVDRLLQVEPFRSMDPSVFPARVSLKGILANDCRIVELEPGDVVFRQGDYGNSAFLILDGELSVIQGESPMGPAQSSAKKGQGGLIARIGNLLNLLKQEDGIRPKNSADLVSTRKTTLGPRMFFQDVSVILAKGETGRLKQGEIFGELAAINRSPRSVSVIATSNTTLLEIRWQGLRDLMQRDAAIREHINHLYRERSLQTHLRETPLLRNLTAEQIDEIAADVEFESFGSMMWTHAWKSTAESDFAERILAEPLIARQGEYCDGLILVRNGFARVTRVRGSGEQTIEYIGRGSVFGLRELAHNFSTGQQRPWQMTLRATGYVDILRIPASIVETKILPHLKPNELPAQLPAESGAGEKRPGTRRLASRETSVPVSLMETIVQQRLMNGTQAMVIDLNRCTRCDDCVRACSSTHGGTPRFLRDGTVHENWMFTHACMHCADPVCMIGCPTGAISREAESGTVTINDSTCIGCGTCANSCPYSNIQMVARTDPDGKPVVDTETRLPVLQATKCDLCIGSSGGPACQRACPHDALVRIDLSTPSPLTEWIQG